MPRIRTLKPEHRQHRKIGQLSHLEYRLWVGLICEADDDGRLIYDAEQLRVLIFGFHPKVSRAVIETATERLVTLGLVRRYAAAGGEYLDFPSWQDHQRIQKRTPSKLPEYQHSGSPTGTLPESYRNATIGLQPDRKGSDQGSDLVLHCRAIARRLLEFLNHKTGRHYQPVEANLALIAARLRDGATEEQCRAIIGRKVRAWLADAKMAPYLRPATLFNREKFAQYLGELPATAFAAQEPPDAAP